MKQLLLALLTGVTILLSGCYQCVECTNCEDPDNDKEEICYDEAREWYRNRQEWRQDVKAYERANDCDCR